MIGHSLFGSWNITASSGLWQGFAASGAQVYDGTLAFFVFSSVARFGKPRHAPESILKFTRLQYVKQTTVTPESLLFEQGPGDLDDSLPILPGDLLESLVGGGFAEAGFHELAFGPFNQFAIFQRLR